MNIYKKLLYNGKYITLGTVLTTAVLISLWSTNFSFWQISIFCLYQIFFGFYLGKWFLYKEKNIWQIFWGIIFLFCLQIIFLSGIYWFFEINKKIISLILITLPIIISWQKSKELELFDDIEKTDLESYSYIRSHLATKLFAFLVFIGQMEILYVLFSRRFDDTLVSPWTIFGPKFFLAFFLVSTLLLWVVQKSKHTLSNLFLILIHTSIFLNVALIVFKIGFGFDPFVHQATEKWIASKGFILPKNPYYIGQYVLIVMMNLITKIQISELDKFLVPISAGIITPLSAYFCLSKINWKYKLLPAIALIPITILSFFTLTTPNNLALLLAFISVFWIWFETKNSTKQTRIFGFILVITTCCIHAIIGLPLLIIYTASVLVKKLINKDKFKKTFFYTFYQIIMILSLPLALLVNAWRLGQNLKIQNPFYNLDKFWSLFSRPHYIWIDKGNAFWKTLYYYRDCISLLFLIVAILGIIIAWKKYKIKQTFFFIITIIGLFVSGFLLSTMFNFFQVISYEQTDYAHRLLTISKIILLPFFILSLKELFAFLKKQPIKQISIATILSLFLLISFYFTYPTRDPVSFHTGWSVRQADIQAVHFIDNLNNNKKNYIVLTNQLVSAAALKEFGFAKYFKTPTGEQFFYAIPTGGPLYQYFRKMVYQEPKKEWMEQAMTFAGVKKAYFIHTSYWAPAAEIRDKAKLEADDWWELADGRVWVYEYMNKE